jgi:hypothetical protein
VDREFRDFNSRVVDLGRNTRNVIFVVPNLLDGPFEAAPPWQHRYNVLAVHQAPDVSNNIDWVIAWYRSAPT